MDPTNIARIRCDTMDPTNTLKIRCDTILRSEFEA